MDEPDGADKTGFTQHRQGAKANGDTQPMTDSHETAPSPSPSRRKPFLWGCATGVLGTFLSLVLLTVGLVALSYYKPFQDFLVAHKKAQLKPATPGSGIDGDYSLKLEQTGGEPLALETLKGKTVFLHFWSPACFNCLPELTGLNRLYQSLQGSDVQFVAVAISGLDELSRVAQENGLSFPLYSFKDPLPPLYQGGTPITVILSPAGEVVLKHKGSAKWDAPEVTALLKGLSAFTPAPAQP